MTSRLDNSATADRYRLSKQGPGSVKFDSGISDCFVSIPEPESCSNAYNSQRDERPPPPALLLGDCLVDTENGDSGINMGDEDTERDCPARTYKGQMKPFASQPDAEPMELDDHPVSRKNVVTPRSSSRSPPAQLPKPKKPVPRFPKKTTPFTTASTSSNTTVSVRTTPALPQRPTVERSQGCSQPTANKENQGFASLPAMRCSSPLTCNNYKSLNVSDAHRVPPLVTMDIHQLHEYMSYFLPDTKDGDT